MIVDFKNIDFREIPVLTLQNADGMDIQTLGYAFNLKAELSFNETSTITFDLPAYAETMVDGKITLSRTPHYDDVTGLRIIDMDGWGKFVLVDPSIKMEGKKEIKSCKAYSLEYELTYKNITLEDSTYNLYNPVTPDSTILGIIESLLPSWSIGEVDGDLIGRYRTFSVSGENVYNFIKSTVQETYSCIFDFDTYHRKINVISTDSNRNTSPVYISLNNLAKSISITEDTESIVTVLDVNGADGVSIRSVNPLGTNKIYNLDYYMNESNFSNEMIEKWTSWKETFNNNQRAYYDKALERMLKSSAISTEKSRLVDMQEIELGELKNKQSVIIELEATGKDPEADEEYKKYCENLGVLGLNLSDINEKIEEKEEEISEQERYVKQLEDDKETLTSELKSIIGETAFSNYFNDEELITLDRYFKEDSISESSFVLPSYDSYVDSDISNIIKEGSLEFENSIITKTSSEYKQKIDNGDDVTYTKDMYSIKGGNLVFDLKMKNRDDESKNDTSYIKADIISATFEVSSKDNSFVLSCYVASNTVLDSKPEKEDDDESSGIKKEYDSGCISITGICSGISNDITANEEMPDVYFEGTWISFEVEDKEDNSVGARFYFTQNLTEYSSFSVEWELFEYGMDTLKKLSSPSYTFDVTSANFFFLDEFESFAREVSLGNRIYLDIGEDKILEPFLIGVDINFENPDSFSLKFGDKYCSSEGKFNLVDLLEQSISMGKSVDTNRFNYNSFIDSGASTKVKEYMNSSLDVAKNNILSSGPVSFNVDSTGIRGRKYINGTLDKNEIAIINNSIVFTNDNWESAKMAIGQVLGENGEQWGVVADNIVGKLLAGENLVIEGKDNESNVVFKVDGSGATLHNASFDITKDIMGGKLQVALNPTIGIGIGEYPIIEKDEDNEYVFHEDKAKFFVDSNGNLTLKGILNGCDGYFDGTIYARKIVVANDDFNPEEDDPTNPDNSNKIEYVFDTSVGESGMFKTKYLDLGNIIIDGSRESDGRWRGIISIGSGVDKNGDGIFTEGILLDGDGNMSLTGDIDIGDGMITLEGNTGAIKGVKITSKEIDDKTNLPTGAYIELDGGHFHSYDYYGTSSGVETYGECDINIGKMECKWMNRSADGGTEYYEQYATIVEPNGVQFRSYVNNGSITGGLRMIQNGVIEEKKEDIIDMYSKKAITIKPWSSGSGGFFCFGNTGDSYNSVHPDKNNTCHVGTTGYRFKSVWAESIYSTNAPITDSDVRLKCDISNDYSGIESFFDKLNPITYKFCGDSNTHFGFAAQEVESALIDSGMAADKMSILSKTIIDKNTDIAKQINDTTLYGLQYSEFIAVNTYMIKRLKSRIEYLEHKMSKLLEGKDFV